jgi:transposase
MTMKKPLILDDSQRSVLSQWVRSRTVTIRWRARARARIILAAANGSTDQAIADTLGTTRYRVARWRARFIEDGVEALKKDLPRGGHPPKVNAGKAQEIVRMTTQTTPANATHGSTRSMAAHAGVSDSTVLRIWRAHGLKPHRVESFKLSNDPQLAE